MTRTWAVALVLTLCGSPATDAMAQQRANDAPIPPLVRRTMPGPGQQALQPLAGTWRAEMSLHVAIGTPDRPAVGELTTQREWVGDGRFLRDTTEGTLAGRPYFRTGLLGYNNMERRHEWVTADNFTPILMSYRAAKGAGVRMPIRMDGTFTDPGVTGEDNVGRSIPMRTVIRIESDDRHVFELYFTPAGKKEVMASRMVFTRVK